MEENEKTVVDFTIDYPIDYELVEGEGSQPKIRVFGVTGDNFKSELLFKYNFENEYNDRGDLYNLNSDIKKNMKIVKKSAVRELITYIFFPLIIIGFATFITGLISNGMVLAGITRIGYFLMWSSILINNTSKLLCRNKDILGFGLPILRRKKFYEKKAKELNKQYEEINKLGFICTINTDVDFPISKKDIYCTKRLKKFKKVSKDFKKIIKEHKEEIEYIRYQDSIKKPEVLELPNEKEDILGTINEVENRFTPSFTSETSKKHLLEKTIR